MTPTITDAAIFDALWSYVDGIVITGTEVVRGQVNRVPMPAGADWITLTPARIRPMAVPQRDYDPDNAQRTVSRGTAIVYAADVYGPHAADNAQIVSLLLRDSSANEHFDPLHLGALDASDPSQMPLVAGEQQWIERWRFDITLYARLGVVIATDFADNIAITLAKAD